MKFLKEFFIVSNIEEAKSMVQEWNSNGQYSDYTDIAFYTLDTPSCYGDPKENIFIGRVENKPPNFGFVWQKNS